MRTMAHLGDITEAHRREDASVTRTNIDPENFVDFVYLGLP